MLLSKPSQELKMDTHKVSHRAAHYAVPVILCILLAVIPTFVHYSNNVQKLTPASLSHMLVFNAVLAIIVYVICLAFTRLRSFQAANAAFIFLIFFNLYGLVYRYLLNLDVIRIKHYTLLPLMIMVAIYGMAFITRLNASNSVSLWKYLLLVVSVLVLFNLINIIPAELKRWQSNRMTSSLAMQATSSTDKKTPDIYYIIFDEFEGFQGMRDYWHYEGVNDFVQFLKEKGFFIAEASHGDSIDTLHEMVTRLNYQEYPFGGENLPTYLRDIADNRAMAYLKARGYTTVAFDETIMGYPSAQSMRADYLYEYGSSSIPQGEMGAYGFYFDEFGELVIDNTMLYAVSQKYKSNNPLVSQHTNMISFTVDNLASKDIPSPKFVHVHLLLPHAPFAFNEDGSLGDSNHFTNWNYYLDNYKFSIKVAEAMVENILSNADPKNPPVIILQSDHGARNRQSPGEDSVILQDYPEDLKSLIMFALYMPGYDYSSLPQNIRPINTFPIVFNYLFQDEIPLLK